MRTGRSEDMASRHVHHPKLAGATDTALAGPVRVTVPDLLRSRSWGSMGIGNSVSSKLRVSTIDFQSACHHKVFTAFDDQYPGVNLTVSMSNDAVSLTRREADVALRLTRAPPEHLVGRKVAEVRYAAYGSKALVDRIGRNVPYEAFPWLHLDERMNPRGLDGWLTENAPGARIAMRLDSANRHHRKRPGKRAPTSLRW